MKKILFLSIGVIFILTGCGAGVTQTMNCKYETTTGNITSKMSYNIDHEENEVKKIRIT